MAMLAMHQTGMMLMRHAARAAAGRDACRHAAGASRKARVPVWLPMKLATATRPSRATGRSTSDGLAARLAERLGGAPVVLVKSCRVPRSAIGGCACPGQASSIRRSPAIVERARLSWRVLGAGDEAELADLLGISAIDPVDAPREHARAIAAAEIDLLSGKYGAKDAVEARLHMAMAKKLLFLTGHLAEPRLAATVAAWASPNGSWRIANLGIKVAALMTEAHRQATGSRGRSTPTRVIVPGRARMNLGHLAEHYGVPFERGPDEIVDLPQYLGHGGQPPDLSKHDMRIFAEIVEAPTLSVETLVDARARAQGGQGADVIDIGCQPDVPFPHLEEAVAALKGARASRSASIPATSTSCAAAARAGADYVLSASMRSTPRCDRRARSACRSWCRSRTAISTRCIRAIDLGKAKGIPHIADPVLDPIHFGFMTSLERYARAAPRAPRRRDPDGHRQPDRADRRRQRRRHGGAARHLLRAQDPQRAHRAGVAAHAPHGRGARRRAPSHVSARGRTAACRRATATSCCRCTSCGPIPTRPSRSPRRRRPSRLRTTASRRRTTACTSTIATVTTSPPIRSQLFDKLGVETDGAHAFYLGYELAKAEIARALGKRYAQDSRSIGASPPTRRART